MELYDALEEVRDSESFLRFARMLQQEREDEAEKERTNPSPPWCPGPHGWENGTIESFLEAAIAWAEDSRFGEGQGLSPKNPWLQFASFLYAGKIYE